MMVVAVVVGRGARPARPQDLFIAIIWRIRVNIQVNSAYVRTIGEHAPSKAEEGAVWGGLSGDVVVVLRCGYGANAW